MNDRQLVRNQGRIPRILFHIARLTEAKVPNLAERVKSYQAELHRRCLVMELGGFKDLCDKLLQVKLDAHEPTTLPTVARIVAYRAVEAEEKLEADLEAAKALIAANA